MTTARGHFGNGAPEREPGALGAGHVFQLATLFAALAGLSLVLFAASAPVGPAIGLPPVSNDRSDPTPPLPPSTFASPPARLHLVLIVDEDEAASMLQRRIAADALVAAERGAYTARPNAEVVVVRNDEEFARLLAGLDEFESLCAVDVCPAIRVLDLRSASDERARH